MKTLRTAAAPIGAVALLSGLVVVARAGQLGVRPEDGVAMGALAIVAGLAVAGLYAAVARYWRGAALLVAAGGITIGIYLSIVAVRDVPSAAPVYIVLHVVWVIGYACVLPYLLNRGEAGARRLAR